MNERDERGTDILAETDAQSPDDVRDEDAEEGAIDRDPTAGASDIGGRAGGGDDEPTR